MAYAASGLAKLAHADSAPSLWSYVTTADANNDIDTAAYFNDASTMLSVGDIIYTNTTDGRGFTQVLSNAAGVVDVADITTIAATDTR